MRLNSRGVTLIELMTVVFILGILCATAAPSFTRALRHRSLNQVAHGLGSLIYKGRSAAILYRTNARVTVDSGHFILYTYTGGFAPVRWPTDPNENIDSSINITFSDVLVFNFRGSLIDGHGSPYSNGLITITDGKTGEVLNMNINNSGAISYQN